MKIVELSKLSGVERGKLFVRSSVEAGDVCVRVEKIMGEVRKNGDSALKRFALEFDGVNLNDLRVSEREFEDALKQVKPSVVSALEFAKNNLERVCRKQKPKNSKVKISYGVVEQLFVPLERVGVYAPGGKASYPSSLLMGVVPAQVAGVKEIVVCTPPNREGKVDASVLAACKICGVKKVFKAGGAQAVAAMAFGTESIPRVQKIVGPGNVFVATAKMLARAKGVEIDLPAGPSEVLIICDERADASLVAADLLAQAEHDENASAVALVASRSQAEEVLEQVELQLARLARKEIAGKSLERFGLLVVCPRVEDALDFANEYAPEHLELLVKNARSLVGKVRNAGAVFVGSWSAEAFGDYTAGSNHVLPTSGSARVFSGLGVDSFMKRVNAIELSENGVQALGSATVELAEAEGLGAHAESVRKRMRK
ncbi:histidinol dehydrogenase [Candidatus Micrarchaeota archaeon]|nr:histidinol dehydrogenase [Candidatus Micrarchaeota archaeon]